jgi:hypothetical protein
MLVSNSTSVSAANVFLQDSDLDQTAVHSLTTDMNPERLCSLTAGVLSAYIKVCAQTRSLSGETWPQIRRAFTLSKICMQRKRGMNAASLWGPILKNLSQYHHGMGLTISEQLKYVLEILGQIEKDGKLPLSTLMQFVKCIRKIAKRILDPLLRDLSSGNTAEGNPMIYLYDRGAQKEGGVTSRHYGTAQAADVSAFLTATSRMKSEFDRLVSDEEQTQKMFRAHRISAADVMVSREDPVRADYAHEYMLALAYVGEFDEMARLLRWLVEQWSLPELAQALSAKGVMPTYADFLDTSCAFRLLAEPMLNEEVLASVEDEVQQSCLEWPWPDEDALEAYIHRQHDDTILTLERVLAWVRFRRKVNTVNTDR